MPTDKQRERARKAMEAAYAEADKIAARMTDDEMDEAWAELRREELSDAD